jgi:hypothetical protein
MAGQMVTAMAEYSAVQKAELTVDLKVQYLEHS